MTCPATVADPSFCQDERLAYAPRMIERLDDSALMLRYAEGDASAFEVLYHRHNDSLYRYLYRLSLNSHTAEDLFQEAWGKVIRSRQRYRPTAKFSTYLFRVAHNCFIDYLRRNRKHAGDADSDPDASPHPGDSPETVTETAMARRRLYEVLKTLPAEQRDAFLLHEEAGLSVDDIAKVTGVNRETAKSRLRYAGAKLRAGMASVGQSQGQHSDADDD